jgi:Flp pilus assembly protein TadG
MVEFALVAPVLLLLLFGLIDSSRLMQSAVTVAAAARDGARQAVADAAPADAPFVSGGSGACPGVSLTTATSGTGCLTDARVAETVAARLGSITTATSVYPGTRGDVCPAPSPGSASICIDPQQSGAAVYSSCAAASAALGRDPGPDDLGGRQAEWTGRATRGCFLVQVTVVFAYSPMTPAIGRLIPAAFLLSSTTTLLAEY